MNIDYLDRDEYRTIPLLKMEDNNHGGLPFFIRKYVLDSDSNSTRLHRHEYMQINYIIKGKGKHIINQKGFNITKGDVFVIPPYIPHCISYDGSSLEVFEFEFVPEFINQSFDSIENAMTILDFAYIEPFLVSESMISPRLNLIGDVQMETESILNEALYEYSRQRQGFMLMIKSLLLKLLVILGREFTKNLYNSEDHNLYIRHRDAILKAIDYIKQNYSMPVGIDEVSRVSLLSQSYFSYLFKSITSKTFIEYLNSMRISKAMELLRYTDKKVLDISYEVGFNNVNHFNRIFRQQIGSSPLEYRKGQK